MLEQETTHSAYEYSQRDISSWATVVDSRLGKGVKIWEYSKCFLCSVGDDTYVAPFCEIQRGVSIGRGCKILPHCFVCEGTVIEDGVFLGPGVIFTNDRYPRALSNGKPRKKDQWRFEPSVVKENASIGAGALILPGVTIGRYATVGAGSVVTKNVAPFSIVRGNPARFVRTILEHEIEALTNPNGKG